MSRPLRVALAALIAAALLASAASVAQAACPKTSLTDLEDEVMCPICGETLALAGGPQSEDERNFIRERVAQCASKQQIKDELVAQYGRNVLDVPSRHGFGLTAYVLPVAAVILGLLGVGFGAWRWRRSRDQAGPGAGGPPLRDATLEADLERYDL